jgi:mono/diheme cytochrome c family protein
MSLRSGKWGAVVVGAILALGLGVARAAAQEPDGADLYRQQCRSCHGAKGVPPQRMMSVYPGLKTLADSTFMAKFSVDSIVAVLRHGAGRDMKPFGDRLSPAQMTAVAKFVKGLAAAPHTP